MTGLLAAVGHMWGTVQHICEGQYDRSVSYSMTGLWATVGHICGVQNNIFVKDSMTDLLGTVLVQYDRLVSCSVKDL